MIPVTLAGYLLDYWANKWLLLRWSCRPKGGDEKIAMRMLLFLNPAVVLYAVTTFLAFREIRTDMQDVGRALCALSVFFLSLTSTVDSATLSLVIAQTMPPCVPIQYFPRRPTSPPTQ